ncbi:zinc-dependent peptidase [uncultured Croceitalea sp.]|uniref:zinc-dependent peptidase n=1 Tax=uncultured Croceitalea sp. TaxID=1798908 RepID=UPI0033063C09
MDNLTNFEELIKLLPYLVYIALFSCFVLAFVKLIYERLAQERFTFFNLFHPVKSINAKERYFISSFLVPFQSFTPAQKKLFLKRFAWFKSKKSFVFYGDIENKEEIKAYVSASAILMTLGLKNFRFENSISRVIIYPSQYYSNIGKRHHIGEYNPRMKILVFSAEDLKHGFKIPNDNKNLGLHEVAHALLFENRRKSTWEARKFKVGLAKLGKVFNSEGFQQKMDSSEYLRDYAKTNFIEFFAVLVESFFESPKDLEKEFPEFYFYLKKMLNYNMQR